MYIKQIIIQGFKSYGERTVVEPFHPRHNVVVGRNGSGKSNFFYAIQFVLCDEFSHPRPEQRQALLHESTGQRVISAHVEIIFDNSDGRLPIAKEEVHVRRVIGAKKDQYFLNKNLVPRSDVMNLLESAGFSRSNPYYIVRQGQINQMAIASDSQRLKLLQEIAGTRVYDDKREESKCLLKEIEGKLEKSQEFLRIIEEHLKTLEEEKDELKIYQQWDKQRRCLEYTIHERKLKENKKKLEELERVSVNSRFEQGRLFAEAKAAQEMVRVATKRLKEAKKEVQSANEERDALSAEQQQLLKEKTKLTFTINDLLEEVKGDNDSKERTQQELKELEANIAAREEELEKLKPEYEEMKRVENELTRELQLKEQKRKELYAKQGRGSQFASKDERDKWIRTELEQLAKQIKDKEEHEKRISEDMKRDAEELVVLENKIEEHMREMEQQRTSIDERMNQNYELTKAKDQWLVIRKEQYRQENVSQLNLSGLKEDLAKADQNLRSMAGKAIMNGRDSVRKVLDTLRQREDMAHKVRSYYGPVIENFSCEKSLYTAVEVIAGNRLFHHIVETDTFGTKILKEMNKQRLPGEVTFVPLNRLRVKDIKYPETSDAIPMISKLQYDQKYARAMRFIFEKTLICRNLEAATNLARMSGLDCVTLEGDRVSSKGFMTGGYFDTSRSRLKIQKTRSELIAQIESLESQLSTLKEEIRKSDQNIISYVSEMQKTETRISKAKNMFDKMNADLRLMKEELSTIKRYRTSKEQSLMQCTSSLKALRATQEGFESELHEELTSELSVADQQQVDFLNDDIRRLTKDNKDAFVKRMRLEAEKNKLENFLTNNLIRKKNELVQALQEISVEDRQHKLESSKAQLADVEKVLVRVNSDFEAQNERVTNAIKKQKSESVEVEKWKLKQKEVQEKIDANGKDVEKLASKLNILQQKIVECTQRITELGALPSHEMYVKFCEMTTKQLFKEMEKVNDYLKKYSNVNKKALDQFMSISDQKEILVKKKEKLDKGDEKIRELMSVLEQRKCEAILFTFEQMSEYFNKVFKKLVPSGHANLIMRIADEDEGHDTMNESTDSDRFIGIDVKVSFTGHAAEIRQMNQLSGGQKSLVALALIFAIQKCNPAPFYLFDEVDQALDAQHRTAVADVIHELSLNAQFITTTLRPELLKHANKFYGVKFRNRVSHVVCISREEAANFVEDDAKHD